MAKYAYKLKDTDLHDSRCINGIILTKSKWFETDACYDRFKEPPFDQMIDIKMNDGLLKSKPAKKVEPVVVEEPIVEKTLVEEVAESIPEATTELVTEDEVQEALEDDENSEVIYDSETE